MLVTLPLPVLLLEIELLPIRPTPPTVPPELTVRFGVPELTFGPNVRVRIAAAACSLLFVLMGVVFFLLGQAGMPLAGWVSGTLGVPLVALGVVILIVVRLAPFNWVFVCPGGVIRTLGATWDGIGWDEIERFEDASLGHTGVTIRQCRLVLTDGGEWGFQSDHVAEYGRLVETLSQKVADRVAPPAAARGTGPQSNAAPNPTRDIGSGSSP